jgi:hypothetical protein
MDFGQQLPRGEDAAAGDEATGRKELAFRLKSEGALSLKRAPRPVRDGQSFAFTGREWTRSSPRARARDTRPAILLRLTPSSWSICDSAAIASSITAPYAHRRRNS